jgi:preprotein translocase subunit SecA
LGGSVEAEIGQLKDATAEQIEEVRAAWRKRNEQVIAAGGLHIIGTERHESRRIDNQLRGRAGRQGDPGMSRFYLSLEDSLMRIFASDRVKGIMQALGMEKGEAIEHRMVTNAIEKAQRKVEARNFDMRKQLLEYDDVANDQRQIVYQQRNELLEFDSIGDTIDAIRVDVVNAVFDEYIPPGSLEEQWDTAGLEKRLETEFGVQAPVSQWLEEDKSLHEETLRERIVADVNAAYARKRESIGDEIVRLEKYIMLQVLDGLWKEHLSMMDHLRHGIHLRAYAQKNPKQEYKREAFALFEQMLDNLKRDVVRFLSHVEIRRDDELAQLEQQRRDEEAHRKMLFQHAQVSAIDEGDEEQNSIPQLAQPAAAPAAPFVRDEAKIGRNEVCHCGSGKKFKHCHGKLS